MCRTITRPGPFFGTVFPCFLENGWPRMAGGAGGPANQQLLLANTSSYRPHRRVLASRHPAGDHRSIFVSQASTVDSCAVFTTLTPPPPAIWYPGVLISAECSIRPGITNFWGILILRRCVPHVIFTFPSVFLSIDCMKHSDSAAVARACASVSNAKKQMKLISLFK